MIEIPDFGIDQESLIGLYNELADEINSDKTKLAALKDDRPFDEIENDPTVNYLQGRVVGFETAMNGLKAYLVARSSEAAGKLKPEDV